MVIHITYTENQVIGNIRKKIHIDISMKTVLLYICISYQNHSKHIAISPSKKKKDKRKYNNKNRLSLYFKMIFFSFLTDR